MSSELSCRKSDGHTDGGERTYFQLVPARLGQLFSFYHVLVHGAEFPPSRSSRNDARSYAAESVSAAPPLQATVDSDSNQDSIPDTLNTYSPCDHLLSFLSRLGLTATTRRSRRDNHLHSSHSLLLPSLLTRSFVGAVCCPALPPFELDMSVRSRVRVPATPRVISPSPTPSETPAQSSQDSSHSGPVTRSAARKRRSNPQPVEEDEGEENEPSSRRSRTRSRSPGETARLRRLTSRKGSSSSTKLQESANIDPSAAHANGGSEKMNGHLAPPSATPQGWSWRDFSRSPSPLGLIPVHRQWRTLIHKHEVPRKALHVSIGFFTLWLYSRGTQTGEVAPWLMGALIPIATVDFLRHHSPSFNRLYVTVLGALMRESEVNGYNGVVFYLLGAWFVLYFFPKDVGVMGVLLLSWCDTAASTFGRLWGRYTPRLRRGKSLAGSLSAFLVGVATSWLFWGVLAPRTGPFPGDSEWPFMFNNVLRLPAVAAEALGLEASQASISGTLALGVMSLWSGLVAAGSELIDLFGLDDNLTIPVFSGLGIWGFLKVFT
ncbi:hypothetical protein VUR80DRAFT_7408 [Thermomyces stellatus]